MTRPLLVGTTEALQHMQRFAGAYAETMGPDELLNVSAAISAGMRDHWIEAFKNAGNFQTASLALQIIAHAEVIRITNRAAVERLGLDVRAGIDFDGPAPEPSFQTVMEDLLSILHQALTDDLGGEVQ